MRIFQPPAPGGLVQNTAQVVAASLSASASVTLPVTNLFGKSALIYFNIHALPGSGSTTMALKVRSVDPVNGGFVTIVNYAARSASGMIVSSINPFIQSISTIGSLGLPNQCVAVPRDLSFLLSMSTGATSKEVTFSLGIHWGL